MDESIVVLPSARAIRHEQLSLQGNTLFLPNFITMHEFISKLCIVDDFKLLDEDSRILLLLEASDFKAFDALQIERNFFTFVKNSSYIFKFFEEISAELYDINNLTSSDIYAEYEEHITILQELYKRYEALCMERKLLDRIFLPKLYTFNKEYLAQYNSLQIHVDGHLTNFEFELLEECSRYIDIEIFFKSSEFNLKMQKKFLDFGVELEKNYAYKISFNDKKVISQSSIELNKNISCVSLSESLLQIAFIKERVYHFVKKGYHPRDIAIVLPDEKMASLLKIFDEKINFNFAMGESFTTSLLYQKLYTAYEYLNQNSEENIARLNRVAEDVYEEVREIFYKDFHEVDFIAFLNSYAEGFSNKIELKIFKEEVHSFKNILAFMHGMSIKSLLSLFLQRLAQRTLDDIRGGQITVMGVLETRSIHFDAVIIIDFSDANVPKRSDKDMFLNTQIREIANLPTMNDRENLQKHYYQMLINASKEVALSFVKSNDSNPSRFLKQLGIQESETYSEEEYSNILFQRTSKPLFEEQEIIREYSFKDKKISATRLKTFLTCKRKYYYRYILTLQNHEIPQDMPKEYEIGNIVHSALKELYSKQNRYINVDALKRDLHKELENARGKSELDKYLINLQKRRMDDFCEYEVQHFQEGWSVIACEEYFSTTFAGATIVGQIDRVDKKENLIEVLDYKTGSYPLYTKNSFQDATDFQLEFYYLLASSLGNVESCGYYDLKESKIVPEAFLDEKLAILESHIKDLLAIETVNFEKCEESKNCQFCEFSILCNR